MSLTKGTGFKMFLMKQVLFSAPQTWSGMGRKQKRASFRFCISSGGSWCKWPKLTFKFHFASAEKGNNPFKLLKQINKYIDQTISQAFIFSQCFQKSDKALWESQLWVLKCHFKTNGILHPWSKITHALLAITQEIQLPVTPLRALCTLSSPPHTHSLLVCKAHTGNRKKGLALYSLLQSCQGTNLSCRWSAPPTSLHPPSWCWWWLHPRWSSAHHRAGPGNQTPLWPPLEGKETKRAT